MKKRIPLHSESYRELLDHAARYAVADRSTLLRTGDLFNAATALHPDHMLRLMGTENAIFPNQPPLATSRKTQRRTVWFSDGTDRYLSLYGGVLSEILGPDLDCTSIDAFHVCAALLLHPGNNAAEFLNFNGVDFHSPLWASRIMAEVAKFNDECREKACRQNLGRVLDEWRRVRHRMGNICFGQEPAIRNVVAQIAAFRGQRPGERNRRPLVFCFIGESGTGKTLLAELVRDAVAEITGEPGAPTLDLARYANEQLAIDLVGRDPSWRDGGKTGALTELSSNHPNGVLILDNFDSAHANALNHIATVITDGMIKDGNTRETVSFSGNIIILTMNRGAEFFQTGKFQRLFLSNGGMIPKEKLVEGILSSLDLKGLDVGGPIGSIIRKSDHPIIFSRLDCETTRKIALKALDGALRRVETVFGAKTEINREQFADFIIETLQNFGSAHGIDQTVEDIIVTRLQNACIETGYEGEACKTIRYEIDDIPPLEKEMPTPNLESPESRLKHTEARLALAKRLDFNTDVKMAEETCVIHIGGLSYSTMPAIEDADWFSVKPSNMSWNDLVGLEEPRRHVQRILKHFRGENSRELMPETGILLWGPPGTGKTSFAKAVAAEISAPFISVCGADFIATHNDNRAIERVHRLFSVARRNKAVVFIDEIDALGNRDSVIGAQASVINTFLSELDGTDERKVLVIGATNRIDRIDKALMRPGRMHKLVKIDCLRKPEDRRRLVKMISNKAGKPIPSALEDFIVETTDGWAPANIQSVLRETFHNAGEDMPTREDFVTARTMEFEGDETQHRELSEPEKRNVAIHEAGHALLTQRYGHKWIQVTLRGGINSLGFIELSDNDSTGKSARQLKESIDIALAGHAAELVAGEASEGSVDDFRKATDYARRLLISGLCEGGEIALAPDETHRNADWQRVRPKINALLRKRLSLTVEYLHTNRHLLESTAGLLVQKEILFPDEIPTIRRKNIKLPKEKRSRT